MGRPFLEHMGGRRFYSCNECGTYLSNKKEILSYAFRGATGQAYLFRRVVNIGVAKVEQRYMLTGRHLVRDIHCKVCLTKLGWLYEYAHDSEQAYKEGHVILERKLLKEDLAQDASLAERNQLTRASSVSSMSSGLSSSVTIS